MKFSSSLKFNAVAEWWDEYIAYSALKKYIFQLEKQVTDSNETGQLQDLEANERSRLMDERGETSMNIRAADKFFAGLLDKELEKIVKFYIETEADVAKDIETLEADIAQKDAEGPSPAGSEYDEDDDDEDDEDDEDAKLRRRSNSRPSGARGHSPSDLRYSVSDYGELAVSTTLSASRAGGSSPDARRRARTSSEAGKGPVPRSTLSNIIDKVARRASFSEPPPVLDQSVWDSPSNHARDIRMLFKRRITTLYNTTVGLRSYVELNYSGFRKILKKYDKVLDSSLQAPYLHEKVEPTHPWLPETKSRLNSWISNLTALYAKCVTHGDAAAAQKQLKVQQREHIVWERDTVWRQMIGQERRGEIGDGPKGIGESPTKEKKPALIDFTTRWGRIRITKRLVWFSVASIIFLALLLNPVLDRPEPSNCFAILCFATILWATEAIPLFVTSIFVPLLLSVFRVIRSQDEHDTRLTTSQATKYIFSVMFSPTIMLLIGGFTIASAISKTNIDRLLITRVLSFAGTRPSTVLLSFMGVSCFASMWISNVAAPTLCFTLIRPILRTLPPKSSFAPCLILAIALAANIGGQSSPISSPQNLIVLQHMDPPLDWLEWFSVALPVSGVSIILIWLFLLLSYRPGRTADGSLLEIKPIRASKEKFTWKQYWVSFVCITTIGLWCIEHSIEQYVGDMGIIAILPIIAFFSTGVLKKDDFEQFLWSIVFIAMGGSALGKAVEASKLLEAMDVVIRDMISGFSFYAVVMILSVVVLIISTFISHTIASVLLVPIAAEVGANLPEPHPNLLIFLTGLICSTGMGMPVSGFPNQTAATQTDDVGELYLTNVDFLKNGVPASIIATVVVATLGFGLMRAIGLQ